MNRRQAFLTAFGASTAVAAATGQQQSTGGITMIAPCRAADVRKTPDRFGGDGGNWAFSYDTDRFGSIVDVDVSDCVPTGATGVFATITIVDNWQAPGYATAWPTGGRRPTASFANFRAGRDVQATTIPVALGDGQRFSVFTSSHRWTSSNQRSFVVDVVAYVS